MVAHLNFFNFMSKLMPRCVLHLVSFNSWLFVSEALIKSNADTEMDLEALKRGFNLGKTKPVKARTVDRKISEMWDRLDDELLAISQFLELGCNFFEPDRELETAFDSSARPARPNGPRRGRATSGRSRNGRLQPENPTADANGIIAFY